MTSRRSTQRNPSCVYVKWIRIVGGIICPSREKHAIVECNTDVIAITKLASWIGDGRGIGLSGGDLDLEISGSDATTLSCGEDHRAIKLSENIPRIANGVVGDICATIVPDDG